MSIELLTNLLGLSFLINMAILLWWFLFFVFAHDFVYKFHSKWFKLSVETFDAIHYAGMATFKMGTLLFCLIPYLAMHIVG